MYVLDLIDPDALDPSEPQALQRARLLAIRARWQLDLAPSNSSSLSSLFHGALDEETGAEPSRELLRRLDNASSAPLLAEALHTALDRNALDLDRLEVLAARLPVGSREILRLRQELAISRDAYEEALVLNRDWLTVLHRDGASRAELDMAAVRGASIAGRLGQIEESETTLAAMLARSESLPRIVLAQVHFNLGVIAMRRVANTTTRELQRRAAEAEASQRFFQAARDAVADVDGRTASRLRDIADRQLASPFDLTGHSLVQRVPKPAEDDGADAWRNYAFSRMLLGDAPEGIAAAQRAFTESVEAQDARAAMAALDIFLPKYAERLAQSDIFALLSRLDRVIQAEMRPLAPEVELLSRRSEALKLRVSGELTRAAQVLADFLLSDPLPILPHPKGAEAYQELAVLAFDIGQFEISGRAIDVAIDLTPEASARQALFGIARAERLRPFSKHARALEGQSNQDPTALARLRRISNANGPLLERWSAATSVYAWLRRLDPSEILALKAEDLVYILESHRDLDAALAGTPERAMLRAQFAVAAAQIASVTQRGDWRSAVVETIALMRQAPEEQSWQERILRHNTERQIADRMGDLRHVARAAAFVAEELMNRENSDFTDPLVELWDAQRRAGLIVEAGLTATLIDESLAVTRRRFAGEDSRETFFRSRYLTFDRVLRGLETDIDSLSPEDPNRSVLVAVYWVLTEGLKSRFILDQPSRLVADNRSAADALRETSVLSVVGRYLALFQADDQAWPTIQDAITAVEQGVAPFNEALAAQREELGPHDPARIEAIGLTEVQASLDDRTALLIVNARPLDDDDYGGLILMRRDVLHFAPLGQFRWELDVIRPLIEAWSGTDPTEGLSARRALFDALIAPFSDALDGIDKLIISPSGPFSVVPYAALWDEAADANLIEHVDIEITPVSKLLALEAPERHRAPDRLLYVVNPSGGGVLSASEWQSRFAITPSVASVLGRLGDLSHFARAEQQAISRGFPRPLSILRALEDDQTDGTLSRDLLLERLTTAEAAHLSMHGVLPPGADVENALLFLSQTGGFLRPADLVGHDLRGLQTLVLSACEVGRSYSVLSERRLEATRERFIARLSEVSGFPAAFLLQGVQTLIAPISAVSAEQDALLWERFYRELAAGASGSTALARSQRERLASGQGHVRDWALYLAFVQ
ncbi:MAG: CHAT domain-containing protein [Pseudomonadota bacterium]